MRVALIACCAAKLPTGAPARDLYQGALFRKALDHALHTCERLHILSALHGVVDATQRIEPYDLTLATMTRAERALWARRCLAGLQARYPGLTPTFVFLAGAHYRDGLIERLPSTEVPLRGLGIGEQMHWLDERRRERARTAAA